MSWARAGLALLELELIGAGLLTLVSIALHRWSLAAKLGLSFGLGLLAMALSLFGASLMGVAPAPWIGATELLVVWAAVALTGRDRIRDWWPAGGEGRGFEAPPALRAALAVALGLLWAGVAAVALVEPLVEWDVLAIWAFKAKILLQEPLATTPYLTDLSKAYSHLDYPLLWPLAMSWVWASVGEADLLVVKVLAPALFAAFLATFHGLLRRRGDRSGALLFTALLAGIPMVMSQTARMLADVPLSYFAMVSGMATYLWLDGGDRDCLRLGGLFAAGMLWTKNEGMALFGVLVAATAVTLAIQRRSREAPRAAIWLLGVPLSLSGGWLLLRSGIPKLHEDYADRIDLGLLLENLGRIPDLMERSLAYLGDVHDWILFWPLLGLLLACTARYWLRTPLLFLFALAQLPLLVYGLVFVVSPWPPSQLLEASASRLLLHVVPLELLLAAEVVRRAALLPWIRRCGEGGSPPSGAPDSGAPCRV